ncbi:5104_t:CDS:10 [Paraglomus brasilianum]|uniref:5104_t:CDS:1 n=1 Tax=Paraglomus brasilianum TaxID=144538 RepID=A0A9N8VR41_9GLOM|nr:5104_t:CDS:10 [Paraglomus brasilianum]
MGILEKIAEIEKEISRTQKNKATEHHLGLLKAKLAQYRVQLLEPPKGSSKSGEGFDVMKSGDARVVLIGFPSVGKSTLLNKLTKTHSEAGAYEFTTLTCIPGKIEYNGANIQLLDLPGIIEGAAQGKGRGRQVVAVAKTADLVLMLLDATKALLEKELETVGIRLNKAKPNVYFKVKKGGGISFVSTFKLTHLSEKLVYQILHGYKIFNAEVLIREDITVDEFIDVVLGNRICELDLNLRYLLDQVWKYLDLIRIYTKRRGEFPDLEGGLIMRNGANVEHVCHAIHRSLAHEFRYALVWGRSAKHNPQRVGLAHVMENEDVIQVVKKK